jgi:hypothetical protein
VAIPTTSHVSQVVQTGKNDNPPAAVNKAPVEVKPHPDALTSDAGAIREKSNLVGTCSKLINLTK